MILGDKKKKEKNNAARNLMLYIFHAID